MCSVRLADVDAVAACVRDAVAQFQRRSGEGGAEGEAGGGPAGELDPDAGMPAEFSGAALLGRLEAALRRSAAPDGCD